MPDAIADEPDTAEIPVLPNSVYAPVRNPRVRWRSDALEHPTPQPVLPPVVSSQNVPPATPSWSPPLRALRPFRRLRDTQSDPSERVKRSR